MISTIRATLCLVFLTIVIGCGRPDPTDSVSYRRAGRLEFVQLGQGKFSKKQFGDSAFYYVVVPHHKEIYEGNYAPEFDELPVVDEDQSTVRRWLGE